MDRLSNHYRDLLGLNSDWSVDDVEFKPSEKSVKIFVSFVGKNVICPECMDSCSIADHAPERTWRHLDTMQFSTFIVSRTPRSKCNTCGVKTIQVPWADKHSRFTLLFELFALEVMQACTTIHSACLLTGLSWPTLHKLMSRCVERGLSRRKDEHIPYAGLDEKSFRKGHRYITALNDLEKGRVLDVVENRDEESVNKLWNILSTQQRQSIKAVSIDMWQPFINSVTNNVPRADIVHDKFHVTRYLTSAVDTVRKEEHRALHQIGNDILKGTKYDWLRSPENMNSEKWHTFSTLKDSTLKTARAWAIKEQFRWFWTYSYKKSAAKFFVSWYDWAVRSRLDPIREAAKTLKRHIDNIITYIKHMITNAVSEGLNSRIQALKTAARGFHSFENYRIRILFYCGKLDMQPIISH